MILWNFVKAVEYFLNDDINELSPYEGYEEMFI